ncbi:hypothetical protein ISCU110981_03845 [Isoptericola cucumis]
MLEIRYRFIGKRPSSCVLTRLGICCPTNVVDGSVTSDDAPTPTCVTFASHSAGSVPSPGSGNCCARSHRSTARYLPAEVSTCVVTLVVRCREKNVGTVRPAHDVDDVQIRSNGTSGQCALFADVSFPAAQSKPEDFTHRWAAVSTTLAAASAPCSSPARVPYSIDSSEPPRT